MPANGRRDLIRRLKVNYSAHPCTIIHLSLSFFNNHWHRDTWKNFINSAAESLFAWITVLIIYKDLPEETLFIQLLNKFLPALLSLSFIESYLKKSINSADESISAWMTVFAWPSMVAAFSFMRYLFAIRSAARCQIFSLSSSGSRSHVTWAVVATSIALCTMSYHKKAHLQEAVSNIISK